jgi:hypothetical protein
VFIAGLKEEIRNDLMKNPPVGGLYAAFVAAQIIEKALEKPKSKIISKSVRAIDETETEVDAVNHGNGKRPFQKRKPMDKRHLTCYHCQKKGHFAAECKAKARGEPQAPRPDNNNNSRFKKKSSVSAVEREDDYRNPFNYLREEQEAQERDEKREEIATIHALNF